jgi:hypothetical protein
MKDSGLNLYSWRQGLVAGCHEHGNEPKHSKYCGEFIDWLSHFQRSTRAAFDGWL